MRRLGIITRYISLGIIVLVLTNCAPSVQRLMDPVAEPAIQGQSFEMADGTLLPFVKFTALGPEKAVIVAVHGFNDYSNAFEPAAKFWAHRGITTFAYDQRGFGGAPSPGIWASPAALSSDLETVLKLVADRYPDRPIVAVGVSMGGAVVINTFASSRINDALPDGIVLVSPAIWHGGFMGPFYRSLLWLSAHTFPAKTATGSGFDRLASDNIEMLRALGRDPLVIKETRLDTIYGLVGLMRAAWITAANTPGPLLTLFGERDEIVPLSSLRGLEARLPDHQSIWYAEGYHMLLRDLQAEKVWGDVADWVLVR